MRFLEFIEDIDIRIRIIPSAKLSKGSRNRKAIKYCDVISQNGEFEHSIIWHEN